MVTVNELFSGIGAFRKALERLNIPHEIVGISEIDKYAIKSYEAIYGKTRNYGDISKVDKLDYADLWTYGFPCQDISVIGEKKGIIKGETRSGLLYEVQRLLSIAEQNNELPKYLILENVKNLVGKNFKAVFDLWLDFLSGIGYNNYWQVINAKNCGIPQNRERVFVVSIRKDVDTRNFEFPKGYPLTRTLQELLENIKSDEFDVNHDCYEYYLDLSEKQCGTKWENRCNKDYINPKIAHTLSVRGTRHQRPGVSNIISKNNHQQISVVDYKNNHLKIGDLRWLTPKECFRLMGFDDSDFEKAEKVCSNTQLYKQASNSIVVNVLEGILKELLVCKST